MKNKIKSLTTLLYVALFGCLIAAVSGSPAVGLIVATLAFLGIKNTVIPAGSFGEGIPETKTAAEYAEDLRLKHEALNGKIAAKADQSEINELRTELDALKEAKQNAEIKSLTEKQEKEIGELKDILVKQGEALTVLKEAKGQAGHASLEASLKAAFAEKKDEIDAIVKSGGKQEGPLVIKAAVDITTEVTIGAGSTQNTLTVNTGKLSQIRKRELTYLSSVSVGTIASQRALWIEETDEQGTPIFIGEGDGKTKLSVLYVEKTEAVKKIAVYGKVTTEMMDDLPQLISYIKNNLMRRLDIKVEDKLISATGTGDDPKGMEYYATAFSAAASLALNVPNANELDVIEAIALQVKTAYGQPGTLFIHPATMSKIKLIKDETGRPVWKDYVTISGEMVVSGLKIVESTAITEGNFVGGDTKAANVLIREEMTIQIGLDGNDFTNNKKTMLVEKRLVQFVSANDAPVIVKGDFASAIAAILLP
jgi:HK97 family phage major capsid protein